MKPFIYILGVPNFANYEATAALIRVPRDGGIIEYVTTAEERFSRVKHAYTFPLRGVHHCLQAFGLESLEEVDFIYTDYARIPRWLNSGPGYRTLEHEYLTLRLTYPRQRIRVGADLVTALPQGLRTDAAWVALVAVRYDAERDMVEIGFELADKTTEDYVINSPHAVLIEKYDKGVAAIEVTDCDGTAHRVELKEPVEVA